MALYRPYIHILYAKTLYGKKWFGLCVVTFILFGPEKAIKGTGHPNAIQSSFGMSNLNYFFILLIIGAYILFVFFLQKGKSWKCDVTKKKYNKT